MPRIRSGVTALLLVATFLGQGLAADLRVPSAYPTIAAALAATDPGDRIIIAPGIYHEHDLDLAAGVTLYGDPGAPGSVVIDADGQGRVMRAESLDAAVHIKGVTLSGGLAQGENSYRRSGGGLLVSSAEVHLEDARIVENAAEASGGGMRVINGVVDLARCAVRNNVAGLGGGGVDVSYDSEGYVDDTVVAGNEAAWGGGMSIRAGSVVALVDSRLEDNLAGGAPGAGGAVMGDFGAAPTLLRCVVANNDASRGGAVYFATGATPQLTSVTVDRNAAAVAGGGLYCTDSDAAIDHTIVSYNTPSGFTCLNGGHPTLAASDVYGNAGGDWVGELATQIGVNGNFSDDPLYCDITDRHLQDGSPCSAAHSGVGLVGALDVGCQISTDVPVSLEAVQLGARPNPFNPRTEITFTLPVAGHVRLAVYDIRGHRVAALVDGLQPAGQSRVPWDARDDGGRALGSGMYLLVLETGGQRYTSKIMLAR
ncbi:MAG TPA: T9SS type A sorting domain-containing protein [Candidatus Krumholzibacteria bacterium]|nr:T9SS type A sorting domain-containing protein [Candidatus Krumholzibacteria bacterium]HPD72284.1 T9SS type A sorting domain-containing protein [Candidatus Krumholzibacteria bacterium]HRY40784.1 T9SS type A sorting domain-containing protein [Candidatus Krumholzibacteria bacterium]